MTEVIAKPFEDRPDYWEGRYHSILNALLSIDKANISINQEAMKSMDRYERLTHLEAIALKVAEFEWEEHAQ
jgi:hypothetical protein